MFEKIENNQFLYIPKRRATSCYKITNCQRRKLRNFYIRRNGVSAVFAQVIVLVLLLFQRSEDPTGLFIMELLCLFAYLYSEIKRRNILKGSEKVARSPDSIVDIIAGLSRHLTLSILCKKFIIFLIVQSWFIWLVVNYKGSDVEMMYFSFGILLAFGFAWFFQHLIFLGYKISLLVRKEPVLSESK